MATVVTLHVFSGRPNPTWLLSAEQEKELDERVSAAKTFTHQRPSGLLGGLGFRGFSVSRDRFAARGPLDLFVHEGIFDRGSQLPNLVDHVETDKWLLTTSGGAVSDELSTHVASTQAANVTAFATVAPSTGCPPIQAADAPAYQPSLWNSPTVQPHNNCYNYANDQMTGTFAQPGRAHGHSTTPYTCANVTPASVADGLATSPNFTTRRQKGQGWYVALVIWPNNDFHWYRQDQTGCWSHKPGGTPVRNVDNGGNTIKDPAHCNRGPYLDFCGYMVTKHGVVIR